MKIYLSLIILFVWSNVCLQAVIRNVDIDGTEQYTSIQSAINASVPGDTVLVYPGRYVEHVIIQTNNISLVSLEHSTNNPTYIDSTIIDGNHVNSVITVRQNTQSFYIRGFTITNAYIGYGFELITNSSTSIVNCEVKNNSSCGVYVNLSNAFLSGVRIHDNHTTGGGGGIVLNGSGGTLSATFDPVNRCSIYNNTAAAGQDIFAYGLSSDQDIYLDTFTVTNPTSYYAAKTSTGFDFNLNFDILNADHQEINNDLYVSPIGNDANDGLTPQTALKTIHTAIYRIAADSLQQKTVHVLPGTYSNATNQQIFPIAMKSRVRLIGSGIGSTIINRDTALSQPTYTGWVITCESETHYQISGMTLSSSNSTYSSGINGYHCNNVILSDLYLGNFHPGGSTITGQFLRSVLDNITIENITTGNYNGLIAVSVEGTIRNCTFRNALSTFSSEDVSTYPVVGIGTLGHLRIENCIFENLTMSDDNSRAITFGGSDDSPQNSIDIVNCLFRDIHSQNDMIYIVSHNNPIINITNCTFAGNTGNVYTLQMNGIIHINNCIFYDNTPHEINLWPQSGETTQISIDYSCVRNGQNGISFSTGSLINYSQNNISTDPLFIGGVEHGILNYYLSENSPCINAGTPDTTGLYLPLYDLLGNPRIYNNIIDIGAYEWNGTANSDDEISVIAAETITIYPNPFKQSTNIGYKLDIATDVLLEVYNAKGQRVTTLINAKQAKGKHELSWDGYDDLGKPCRTGIYLVKMHLKGTNCITGKLTLIR